MSILSIFKQATEKCCNVSVNKDEPGIVAIDDIPDLLKSCENGDIVIIEIVTMAKSAFKQIMEMVSEL